jgi:predicted DNA-binding WGR domain protein
MADIERVYLENHGGGAFKFWEGSVRPTDTDDSYTHAFVSRWGKIGTAGQTATKFFVFESDARGAMRAKVNDKLRHGYFDPKVASSPVPADAAYTNSAPVTPTTAAAAAEQRLTSVGKRRFTLNPRDD